MFFLATGLLLWRSGRWMRDPVTTISPVGAGVAAAELLSVAAPCTAWADAAVAKLAMPSPKPSSVRF